MASGELLKISEIRVFPEKPFGPIASHSFILFNYYHSQSNGRALPKNYKSELTRSRKSFNFCNTTGTSLPGILMTQPVIDCKAKRIRFRIRRQH